MNKKEFHFLEKKLKELVDSDIISLQQSIEAREFFGSKVKPGKSTGTILAGIGVLLIALSMITLFAVNWDMLSKGVKISISFLQRRIRVPYLQVADFSVAATFPAQTKFYLKWVKSQLTGKSRIYSVKFIDKMCKNH